MTEISYNMCINLQAIK